MCSNVDLRSQFLEFLPESNRRSRDRQSCDVTNLTSFTLSWNNIMSCFAHFLGMCLGMALGVLLLPGPGQFLETS